MFGSNSQPFSPLDHFLLRPFCSLYRLPVSHFAIMLIVLCVFDQNPPNTTTTSSEVRLTDNHSGTPQSSSNQPPPVDMIGSNATESVSISTSGGSAETATTTWANAQSNCINNNTDGNGSIQVGSVVVDGRTKAPRTSNDNGNRNASNDNNSNSNGGINSNADNAANAARANSLELILRPITQSSRW